MQKIVVAISVDNDDKELTVNTIKNALDTTDFRSRYQGLKVTSVETAEQTATEPPTKQEEDAA